MVRTSTMPLSLVCLALILASSITAIAQQSPDKPASSTSAKPTAAPPKAKKVWTNEDIPSRGADSTGSSAGTTNATTDKVATSPADDGPVPKGSFQARPAKNLMKAWANRSLWVKNPPILGGCDCFDFKHFDDCQIWSLDADMRMKSAGGRLCEIREFIADKEPGTVPGDYGLIIGGIGDTYTVTFPQPVTETTRTFAMRDTSGWSFEVFDGPCSARAKK
jgi:hypothetical protein